MFQNRAVEIQCGFLNPGDESVTSGPDPKMIKDFLTLTLYPGFGAVDQLFDLQNNAIEYAKNAVGI